MMLDKLMEIDDDKQVQDERTKRRFVTPCITSVYTQRFDITSIDTFVVS